MKNIKENILYNYKELISLPILQQKIKTIDKTLNNLNELSVLISSEALKNETMIKLTMLSTENAEEKEYKIKEYKIYQNMLSEISLAIFTNFDNECGKFNIQNLFFSDVNKNFSIEELLNIEEIFSCPENIKTDLIKFNNNTDYNDTQGVFNTDVLIIMSFYLIFNHKNSLYSGFQKQYKKYFEKGSIFYNSFINKEKFIFITTSNISTNKMNIEDFSMLYFKISNFKKDHFSIESIFPNIYQNLDYFIQLNEREYIISPRDNHTEINKLHYELFKYIIYFLTNEIFLNSFNNSINPKINMLKDYLIKSIVAINNIKVKTLMEQTRLDFTPNKLLEEIMNINDENVDQFKLNTYFFDLYHEKVISKTLNNNIYFSKLSKLWIEEFEEQAKKQYDLDLKNKKTKKIQNLNQININHIKEVLNIKIYGQENIKTQLLKNISIAKFNKDGFKIQPTLFTGSPGVGKSYLLKTIAEELNIPYLYICLNGMSSWTLTGMDKGWRGSREGEIAKFIKDNNYPKNAIIILDEIDKVLLSEYDNFYASLSLILDENLNKNFKDLFTFESFDLSGFTFFMTSNNLKNNGVGFSNNILPDYLISRINNVFFPDYTRKEKEVIIKNFVLKKVFEKYNFDYSKFELSSDVLDFIIKTSDEGGIRQSEQMLNSIYKEYIYNVEVLNDVNYLFSLSSAKEIFGNNENKIKIGFSE